MRPRDVVLLAAIASGLLEPTHAQERERQKPTISLTGVPERLVLPLPKGENRVLTAQVLHAEAGAVWLATSKGNARRLTLTAAAKGSYQINLADARVTALARSDPERPLRVFARIEGGQTLGSIPISFRLSKRLARVTAFALEGKTRRPLPANGWIWTSGVQALELVIEGSTVGYDAELRIGARVHAFQPADERGVMALRLTPAMRRSWEQNATCTVRYSTHQAFGAAYRMRAIPAQLIPAGEEETRLTVYQRTGVTIPHTNGWLLLACDDVTYGQVRVQLRSADGARIVRWRSMRQGDELDFTSHGTRYSLVLEKLVNILIGKGDHGVFRLERYDEKRRAARSEKRLIRDLLERIRTSGLTFIREGKEYTALQTKKHLEIKLAAHPVDRVESFIRDIASRSSTTGRPYQVKLSPDETVETSKWLREQLAELRKKKE